MTGPYGRAALSYFDRGWLGVLPMLRGKKSPYVPGHHGKQGVYPSREQVAEWVAEYPFANIAIRLPPGFVGIDVDVYHGGDQTLQDLAALHDDLPPTWVSTARDDGSGIRLFRVPGATERSWRDAMGTGIEIVHPGNRYVMAAPSIHPKLGTRYRWIGPDGAIGSLPDLGDL